MNFELLKPLDACGAALALALLLDRAVGGTGRVARLIGPLIATAAAAWAMTLTGRPTAAWLGVGAIAALWSGGRLLSGGPLRSSGVSAGRRGAALVALAGMLGAGWLTTSLARSPWAADGDVLPFYPLARLPLKPHPTLTLTTDRGRPVPAFEAADGLPGDMEPVELEGHILRTWPGADRIARVAGPELASNCHGWTFTGGRCWVRSENVGDILRDNGYRVVGTPRRGDVVVYRSANGEVCHTAVVAGRSRSGEVLVESKWTWAGRFVHPVATQPYSSRYDYYRSRRTGGHVLAAHDAALPAAN